MDCATRRTSTQSSSQSRPDDAAGQDRAARPQGARFLPAAPRGAVTGGCPIRPAASWCSTSIPRTTPPGAPAKASSFATCTRNSARPAQRWSASRPDSGRIAREVQARSTVPVQLLADVDAKVCTQFDVIREKTLYGRKYMGVERSTFLIDETASCVANGARSRWPDMRRPSSTPPESSDRPRRNRGTPESDIAVEEEAVRPASIFVLDTNVLMHDPGGDLPFRGTRRLHTDDGARGTRRRQEGHVRGVRATCARSRDSSTR